MTSLTRSQMYRTVKWNKLPHYTQCNETLTNLFDRFQLLDRPDRLDCGIVGCLLFVHFTTYVLYQLSNLFPIYYMSMVVLTILIPKVISLPSSLFSD